jgi:1,4-dihydroxy-2-naphthoate octaprenyltransferase
MERGPIQIPPTPAMSMHPAKIWILAARPKTLAAGLTPVSIGSALAAGSDAFHWPAALCAALGALLIQIGTNFANDYFDFVKGTDTAVRVGPLRATQAGLVSPRTMLLATVLVFALTFVPGAYLIYRGGWPILAIGLVSVACGVLYTGGPFPLGYVGLGDLFVLVFFGPVAVGGTYYVQAQTVDATVLIAGLMPGLFSTAILTVNNLRDADTDVQTGKRTLAVRFGKAFARWEYTLCVLIAGAALPVYLCLHAGGRWAALAGCLALLPALPLIRNVFSSEDGAVLNDTLAGTGKVLLLFSVLFSVGWLL